MQSESCNLLQYRDKLKGSSRFMIHTSSLCSWIKNSFLLNEILTILDQEKVLMRTLFWNTTRPTEVTPRCMSLFVVSWNIYSIPSYSINHTLALQPLKSVICNPHSITVSCVGLPQGVCIYRRHSRNIYSLPSQNTWAMASNCAPYRCLITTCATCDHAMQHCSMMQKPTIYQLPMHPHSLGMGQQCLVSHVACALSNASRTSSLTHVSNTTHARSQSRPMKVSSAANLIIFQISFTSTFACPKSTVALLWIVLVSMHQLNKSEIFFTFKFSNVPRIS